MTEFLKLKKSDCKNCYKCIRSCPVKSIRFSAGQANIVPDECVLCGQCFVVCPQNAKEIVSEIEQAKVLIMSGAPVIASLAPSFIANFDGVGIEAMEKAMKKLGFSSVEETAIGATIVKREYEKLLDDPSRDVIITSCCHSVNLMIQKHFPSELKYLADVLSPMQAHCRDIKRRSPSAKTVFIGPCLAKKDEADRYPDYVDAVLTFEELSEWLESENIAIESVTGEKLEESRARLFPTAGGVLRSMDLKEAGYTYMAVDGPENCIAALRDIESGKVSHCFIEMSMCKGSCIGGPVMEKYHHSPIRDFASVDRFAGKRDFNVPQPESSALKKQMSYLGIDESEPTDAQIREILGRMGKTKPEDELNCGTCGYDTCREKARAVFLGKADLSMCLPFLKEKAESFSSGVLSNSPNGILVLNDALEVQQINRAAMDVMNIRSSSDVMGEPVVRILDPKDFIDVQSTGRPLRDKRVYLAEYKRWIDMTIVYDRGYKTLLCIMRDVTVEETSREKKDAISRQTVETADRVVEKQMRIVQEIASLLGETAAETKIALTKLKESISDE